MAVFCALLFLTLPTGGQGGNFIAFFGVFMVLFLRPVWAVLQPSR
jgi:NNP family nitrate/nitrite transporter-like MFS transporter